MIQNGQSQLLGGCGLLEVKFETNRYWCEKKVLHGREKEREHT